MHELGIVLLQVGSWTANFLANHHKLIDRVTEVIAICSFLHTVLPPWDWKPAFVTEGLAEFPRSQKLFYASFNNRWYRLLVYVIGYVALNARSTVWKYISVNNPQGPNANAPNTSTPGDR